MTIQIAKDFRSVLGPIRDQGSRPTCFSHAASVAHEKCTNVPSPLSPEYLHYFATGGDIGGGSTPPKMQQSLMKNGQPEEAHCPYGSSTGIPKWSPPKGLSVYKRKSEIRTPTLKEVERAISQESIPVLVITLPIGFYSPANPWIVPATGVTRGLHAVAGVALGDFAGRRLVMVRNSWGSDWGDGGHVWLDETFLAVHFKHLLVLTSEIAA